MTEVQVPQWGLTMDDAILTTWFKVVGDRVAEGESLAEVETDKITSELESPVSGVVSELLVVEGTGVIPGQVVAHITGD
jgi:pyruvate/2-oxoglutarate dehydrogenase complex dihydrolipoamide acyltransferase (E2) component